MCLTAKVSYRQIHFTLQEVKAESQVQVLIPGSNIRVSPPPPPHFPRPSLSLSLILF